MTDPKELPREQYLGSGDAAAIIGVSPYRTAVDVYLAKTEEKSGPEAELEENDPRFRGVVLEPTILDLFEKRQGLQVVDRQLFRTIPGLPFPVGSHIDGRVVSTGDLVEAKSAAFSLRQNWGDPGSADLPEDYLAQAVHHLACNPEAGGIWQPVLFVGFSVKLEVFYVPRDAAFVRDLVDAEVEFARQHLLPRIPPAPTTRFDVQRLFPKDTGKSVEASMELALAVNELSALRESQKLVEEEAVLLEGKVAAAFGDAALLTYAGRALATFRTQKQVRVDSKALLAAHPELAGQYERATEFRVLRLKK